MITNPQDDTVSRLRFNPNPQNGQQFINFGSWRNDVRIEKLPHNNNPQVRLGPQFTPT